MDSIKELSAGRYLEFIKYLIRDAGIGSDYNDVFKRFSKLHNFIDNDKKEHSLRELNNLYQTFFLIIAGLSPKHFAFAINVSSIKFPGIPEKTQKDYSENSLQETIDNLDAAGVTQGDIEEWLEDVKKKLIPN